MKNLHQNLFEDLKNLCLNLNDLQFCLKSELLNQATIGKHLRHSVEFYLCLIQGIPLKRELHQLIQSHPNRNKSVLCF